MAEHQPGLPATVEEIVGQEDSVLLFIPCQHVQELLQTSDITDDTHNTIAIHMNE